jgi:hypothetical protein
MQQNTMIRLRCVVACALAAPAWAAPCPIERLDPDQRYGDGIFGVTTVIDGGRLALTGWCLRVQTGEPYDRFVAIYERSGMSWLETARLWPPEPEGDAGDFGTALLLDGDRLFVGSPRQAFEGAPFAGAVYIYEAQPGGAWTLTATLRPPEPEPVLEFGRALAMHDGQLLVGMPGCYDCPARYGEVLCHVESNGSYEVVQRLRAPAPIASDGFGLRLAVHGERLFVGAPYDGDGEARPGAAHCYRAEDGAWVHESTVRPPSAGVMSFGVGLAASADRLLVGAPGASRIDSDDDRPGAAYVFDRIGANWALTSTLQPAGLADGAAFGRTITISGDRAFIGAPYQSTGDGRPDGGAVYGHDISAPQPQPTATVEAPPDVVSGFGRSLGEGEGHLLITSSRVLDDGEEIVGAVFDFGLVDDLCCPADLDGDGMVGLTDLAILLATFGLEPGDPHYDPRGDVNGDGAIDISDLGALLSSFDQPCPA